MLPGCSGGDTPYATSIGSLEPGATMTVKVAKADVNVYKPKVGDPSDRFTVSPTALAKASPPPPPSLRPAGNGVVILAPNPLRSLLLRVPDKVNISVDDASGNVSVTDITGSADVRTGAGNISIMVSGYARAHSDRGNVNVTMGSLDWPGRIAISAGTGDVVVYVNENAKFRVRMHTGEGVLFTDFPGLRGTSSGKAETIDAPVNGGAARILDIETGGGAVRLLRLAPQA
jgi:hypothetical protein